jgi:stearoyl-CoA desaturase (delta-9 desaturase)
MNNIYIAILFFMAAYFINLLYISVFYHRALAHNSVKLSLKMKRFVIRTGPWIVGLDALAWTCMHRLHHDHADTKEDPHSPHFMGIFGVLWGQLMSYQHIIIGLIKQRKKYVTVVDDIDTHVHWLYRKKLWWLPYIVHIAIAAMFALIFQSTLVGLAYFLGIMSHPIQGWLVNSLAHSKGYRNFETDDKSVNNLLLGYLVFGEGYQNNHHQQPHSAKFGVRWFEFDCGFWLCLLGDKLGFFEIVKVENNIYSENISQIENEGSCNKVNFKRSIIQTISSILLLCFIGVFLIGCKNDIAVIKAPSTIINWTYVKAIQPQNTFRVMGTVISSQYGNLSFERSGKVTLLKIKEGQHIEKGSLIAQLNNRALKINYQQQKAIIEKANVLKIEAKNNFKRSQRLFNKKLTSQSNLEDENTKYNIANHNLTIALTELKHIENELKTGVLLAPFSGVVTRKHVEQEQVVSAGQPIIKLDNKQNVEVEFWLSQHLANDIKLGSKVQVHKSSNFTESALVIAKVTEKAHSNNGTSMMLITAKLTKRPINIESGDTVQVSFEQISNTLDGALNTDRLSLPITAVDIGISKNYSIFKYDDKNKKLVRTAINNVDFYGDFVFFDGQLSPDDIIASSGVSLLKDNQTVQLRHSNKMPANVY